MRFERRILGSNDIYVLESKCVGSLLLCSESNLRCIEAKELRRPWPADLSIAEARGNCCFTVYPFKRYRGNEVLVDPANGQQFIGFRIKSLRKIPC